MTKDALETKPANYLELCLPAFGQVTQEILSRVDAALVEQGFDVQRDDILIALAEALNNIVEHAYQGRGLGAVAISVEATGHRIQIDLRDWGSALPNDVSTNVTVPNPEDLKEGGYGWFLIKTLMSEVRYLRRDRCNYLSLILDR